jgi:ABC-type spermidine/putrescine transport system permease subunit I
VAARGRNESNETGFWGLLVAPGTLWLLALFVVPFYAVVCVAFGRQNPTFGGRDPEWNPLRWDTSPMSDVLRRVLHGDLGTVFTRTFSYVGVTLALCFLIGYPVAYYTARHAGRRRGLVLMALVVPFWISYLMRMLAWANLLQPDGYVNRILRWLHIIDAPKNWLTGNSTTVILGLVYGYIPFFILPLYAALERLDGRLLEAARDLGASPRSAFFRITWPLSRQGALGATVITALPMFGDYYTNGYLSGGSPRTSMIGNQIVFFLQEGNRPEIGAALVLVLSVLLVFLMGYYLLSTARLQREIVYR